MWQEKYGTKANTSFPKVVNLRADLPRHQRRTCPNTVAGLHLTLRGLRGTVEGPIIPRIAHARPQQIFEETQPVRGDGHAAGTVIVRSGQGRQSARAEFLAVRPAL